MPDGTNQLLSIPRQNARYEVVGDIGFKDLETS